MKTGRKIKSLLLGLYNAVCQNKPQQPSAGFNGSLSADRLVRQTSRVNPGPSPGRKGTLPLTQAEKKQKKNSRHAAKTSLIGRGSSSRCFAAGATTFEVGRLWSRAPTKAARVCVHACACSLHKQTHVVHDRGLPQREGEQKNKKARRERANDKVDYGDEKENEQTDRSIYRWWRGRRVRN